MQIVMLGTGHGKAINCYNYCFLMKFDNTNLLVDSGSGPQIVKQLIDSGVGLEDINNIFISHSHIDHILGLIWIVRFLCPKYCNNEISKKLNIYGNYDVIQKIKQILFLLIPTDFHEIIKKSINYIVVNENSNIKIAQAELTFFDIKSKRISEFGFFMRYNNKKIVFLGDEKCNESNFKYLNLCDYAFMDARDVNNRLNSEHSTIEYSATIAQKCGVKNLILSHCNDNDIINRKEVFVSEAKKIYKGNIFVPNDLEIINID